ncbi:MAG: MFS transporter [Rhodospirillales bacterium]
MGWLVLLLTTLAQAVAAFALLTFPAIAPDVAERLHVPAAMIGYQIAITYFGAVATSVYCGPMIRRWGACRTTQLSMISIGAGALLASLGIISLLAAGSLMIGMGYGMTNPAASHLLVRFSGGRHRNLIFSFKQTGVPIGGAMAGLIAPPIVLAFGWQWAPVTVGLCCLATAVLLQPWRGPWDRDRDPRASLVARPQESFLMIWRNRPLRMLAPSGFSFSVVQMCLVTFLVTFLVQEIGFTLLEAGLVLSLTQVSAIGCRLLWGWTADRLGDGLKMIFILGMIMAGIALIVTTIDSGWPKSLIYAVFILYGGTAIAWNGVFLASVSDLTDPKHVGLVTGGIMAITFGGVLVGPAIFASLYPLIGSYGLTYGLLAFVGVSGGLSALYARRQQRQNQ